MSRIIGAGLILLLSLSLPGRAMAWDWLKPAGEEEAGISERRPETAPAQDQRESGAGAGADQGRCIAAIFAAERRYKIPDHLLLALGLQEAGWNSPKGLTIWPWSVNAAGEGRRFASRAEAEAFVSRKLALGVQSIDIGCLQINLRWHPEAFASPSAGFDPGRNVDYAARFLRALYEESGDWQLAAGRYHSRSPGPQSVYLAGLRRNQAVVSRRLAQFQAIAAGGPLPDLPAARQVATESAPPLFRDGAIWGAAIAGHEGARRTLYSAEDLQPVLPDFLPPEA